MFDDQGHKSISISEADINDYENNQKQHSFDPLQKIPSKQHKAVLVEAKCVNTQQLYYLEFRQDDLSSWYFKDAFKHEIIPDQKSVGIKIEKNMISGKINWGNIFCPYCSSTGIVQCAKCKRLTCHHNATAGASFQCAWCGNSGKIGGYIKSLGGSRYKK
ncbi:hypothetical protein DFR64_1297 [Pelolinea submarina]|uniref:TerY-C metal binding domain-containing protein n=2 Tax=Pelolinea submarina TaxID=913107 RepID=A0A3E0AIB0_9CHLR|nr:hypothetical protein DFR64_1297 [Pelolinea submarina]